MRRFLLFVLVVGALGYLVSVGGPARALVAGLFYVLAAYVIWRALPAIREDLRRLPAIPARRRRGDYL